METAAQRYRRIKAEKAAGETLHDVECECGMVWKARRVKLEAWITSGILPTQLVETVVKSFTKGGQGVTKPEELMATMNPRDVMLSIEFAAKVVKHTAAEPRIVERVNDETEISQEDVMTCCFNRLASWQMSGGDEAARLGNFPE